MTGRGDRLALRRHLLAARSVAQRAAVARQLAGIAGGLDRLDRGLAEVGRLASPPVVLAGAAALLFLLGRNRVHRILSGGLALFLATRHVAATGNLVAWLAEQAINRSR